MWTRAEFNKQLSIFIESARQHEDQWELHTSRQHHHWATLLIAPQANERNAITANDDDELHIAIEEVQVEVPTEVHIVYIVVYQAPALMFSQVSNTALNQIIIY